MLVRASIAALVVATLGCKKGSGKEMAEKQAAEEMKVAPAEVAQKINPPVPGGQHIACTTLLDLAAFQKALNEPEPMAVKDVTSTDAEAAASCSLLRGGKRPTPKEMEALSKKGGGRMGAIPGDEVCRITAYCWTIEDETKFKDRCKQLGFQNDDSMGSYACLQIVAQGADDVYSFRFVDPDTKCILKVNGGPSMVDNEYITTCARTARDAIGPANIKPGDAPPPPEPAAGSGTGGGSAAPGPGTGV